MTVAVVLAVLLAVLLAAGLAFFGWPWRVSFAFEGRGTPDGAWMIGGGAAVRGLSVSFAAARRVSPRVEVRFRRWRVWPRPGSAKKERPAAEPRETLALWKLRHERLTRWIDPVDLLVFLVAETGRLAVVDLDVHVRYGLRNPALAGQLSGGLMILAALVSRAGRLQHEVDWTGEESFTARGSAGLRFSPLLIALDTARFVARNIQLVRPRRARATSQIEPQKA